jgi:hypothetical protein
MMRGEGRGPGRGQGPGGEMHGLLTPIWKVEPRIKELQEEIAAIDLFQLLKLSDEQKKEFVQKLGEIRTAIEQAEKEQAVQAQKLVNAMEKMRDALLGGADTTAAQQELKALRQDIRINRQGLMPELQERLQKLRGILTVAQWEKVQSFRPHMMGRANGSQADGQEVPAFIGKFFLERVREMPEQRFRRHFQRMTRRLEHGRGPQSNEVTADQMKKFIELIEKIRAMPKEEFEGKSEQLSEALDPAILAMMEGNRRPMGRAMNQRGRRGGQKMIQKTLVSDAFWKLLTQ